MTALLLVLLAAPHDLKWLRARAAESAAYADSVTGAKAFADSLAQSPIHLRFTAPALRNTGTCDDPILIPASAGVVFCQFLLFNWSAYGGFQYQQVRGVPGQSYTVTKDLIPGRWLVACRTISERGYFNCRDTSITVEVP